MLDGWNTSYSPPSQSHFKKSILSILFSTKNSLNENVGTLSIVKPNEDFTNYQIVKKSIGTVDYVKGEIRLYPVNISSTSKTSFSQPIIEISVIPKSNDVIGLQDLYLQLDVNKSVLNMLSDEISSGSDVSGSTYKVTSSYTNGDLVRI